MRIQDISKGLINYIVRSTLTIPLAIGLNNVIESSKNGAQRERESQIVEILEEKESSSNKTKINLEEIRIYIESFEGRRLKVYDPNPHDNKPEPTIGIGHYLNRPDSREAFEEALPEVNYNEVYNKKIGLNNEQIDRLFEHDIKKYLETTQQLFPEFDDLPGYLQAALVNGVYRGEFKENHEAVKLFNKGNIEKAGIEYLDRKDYKEAVKNRMSGVKTRMEKNQERILRYATELKDSK